MTTALSTSSTEHSRAARWAGGRRPTTLQQASNPARSRSRVRPMSASRSPQRNKPAHPGPPTPPLRRARILNRFLQLCEERTDALAAVITAEHGKNSVRCQGGNPARAGGCGTHSRHPAAPQGGGDGEVGTRVNSHSLRQPLGVVAGITPFNFPVMVPMWMLPVAIACGNAFVLKPSERDPSASPPGGRPAFDPAPTSSCLLCASYGDRAPNKTLSSARHDEDGTELIGQHRFRVFATRWTAARRHSYVSRNSA